MGLPEMTDRIDGFLGCGSASGTPGRSSDASGRIKFHPAGPEPRKSATNDSPSVSLREGALPDPDTVAGCPRAPHGSGPTAIGAATIRRLCAGGLLIRRCGFEWLVWRMRRRGCGFHETGDGNKSPFGHLTACAADRCALEAARSIGSAGWLNGRAGDQSAQVLAIRDDATSSEPECRRRKVAASPMGE